LKHAWADALPLQQQEIEQVVDRVDRVVRKLVVAESTDVNDRIHDAFRSAAAKAAKLASYRGDSEEAKMWFEEATSVDPSNAALWDRYAWFLMVKVGDLAEAKKCAAEARRIAPNDGEAAFTSGMIAARLGEVPEADGLMARARTLGKARHLCELQMARARIDAALMLETRGVPEQVNSLLREALELLRKAEQFPAGTPFAFKHRAEIKKLRARIGDFYRVPKT
jgi:tetratricopeptide (TPR) repeat protein